MGAAGSERLAARIDHRAPEKLARRIRAHRLGSAVEKKTGGGLRGGGDSHPDHSQAHRIAVAFGGRHGVSDSFFAVASGDCRKAGRARARAREGKFSYHPKTEALSDANADAGTGTVRVC